MESAATECRAGVRCMAIAAAPAVPAVLQESIAVQVVRKITDGAIAKKSVVELLSHVHLQTEQFSRRQAEIPTKSSAFSTIMMEICLICRSIPLV
jgi:hypothetical protein